MTRTLLCLPHAGGAPATFRSWPSSIAPGWSSRPGLYPGRDRRFRDPFPPDLVGYARDVLEREGSLLRQGPYALYGHSFGGLLAWEIANLAASSGLPAPVAIVVAGVRPPHVPHRRAPIHELPDGQLVDALVRMQGMDPEVLGSKELLDLILPRIRADLRAAERYVVSRAPIATPILALSGDDDPDAGPADVARWREVTDGPFEHRTFSGGHFFVLDQGLVVPAIGEFLAKHAER